MGRYGRQTRFGGICHWRAVLPGNQVRARNDFLEVFSDLIDPGFFTFLLGEFNTVFDRSMDRCGSDPQENSHESSSALRGLFARCCVTDIWRDLHPLAAGFTWESSNHSRASRIDLIGCPSVWVPFVSNCNIVPCPFSDHKVFYLSLSPPVPTLPAVASSSCDGPLTEAEVLAAVRSMARGKAPGLDGLPLEFYLSFWHLLAPDLLSVLNFSFLDGHFPISSRSGVITLLFKKADRLNPANWRQITLLNVDHKICARALAARLLKVILHVVGPDQTCGVPGRFIGETVALLRDLAYYCEVTNFPAAILSLDQEKAFDRVDIAFLFNTKSKMGFGDSFIKWIRLLYTNARCSVMVNGHLSPFFFPSRGVTQVCPLSPLLYVLNMEVLAWNIRASPSVQGITLPGMSTPLPVLSLYADDVSVITSSERAMEEVFHTYARFERGSGSKLNLDKCEGLWLGGWRGRPDSPVPFQWTSDKVKCLGTFIGNGNLEEANWRPRVDAVARCIATWNSRNLSYAGRALISNALALARVWYMASMFPIPAWALGELNRIIFSFFWKDKKDLVARAVVI